MLSDIASPRYATRQIQNFRGLLTNLADYRTVPTGYCLVAQDVVFDDAGNARPRDGYEQWWPAQGQRKQIAEMDSTALETWVASGDGTAALATTKPYSGPQSLVLTTSGASKTVTGTLSGLSTDIVSGLYPNTDGYETSFYIWLWSNLTNVSDITVTLITAGTVVTLTASAVNNRMTASTWIKIHIGNAVMAAGATAASVAVAVTSGSGGAAVAYADDCFASVSQQSYGSGQEQFCLPSSIAVSPVTGKIYVADGGNCRIKVYSSAKTFLFSFGEVGTGSSQFVALSGYLGVTVDASDNVYVVDTGNSRIQKFTALGAYVLQFGSAGSGDSQFNSPGEAVTDAAGNIFVVDSGNSWVKKFTSAGVFVSKFGGYGSSNGKFTSPEGIAIDAAGFLYVTDTFLNRVQKFTSAGVYDSKFGSTGNTDGKFNYCSTLAVDSSGNIYVVDTQGRIQVFTSAEAFSYKFGVPGIGDGQFGMPYGIALSGSNVLVTDQQSGNIQVFSAAGVFLQKIPDLSYYADSFCLGAHEFRRTNDPNRYLLAGFGDTLYADANEAKTPYKIKSGFTRNLPMYFTEAENRCIVTNGTDANQLFTGTSVRAVGFPAPAQTMAFDTVGGSGGTLTAGAYFYGVSYVYGEGTDLHGESSMTVMTTGQAITGVQTVKLKTIPVGAIGSGVLKRRIYRCSVNDGNFASKYLLKEIADNTTTTLTDDGSLQSDAALILQKEGPLDNGVPPIAKLAKFYDRGMVYANGQQIWYSRPGTDLDSTPETVPAENTFQLPPAGDMRAMVEFNNVLYLFQEMAITSVRWVGSDLVPQPVARSRETGVGAIDQNAVTVYGDDYVLFKDRLGQLHRLLANDTLDPDGGAVYSKPIANLLNDMNPYQPASSIYYDSTDSKAQWDNYGTATAPGDNLEITDDGDLRYKYGVLGTYTPAAGTGVVRFTSVISQPQSSSGSDSSYIGLRQLRLKAGQPIELTSLTVSIGVVKLAPAFDPGRQSFTIYYTLRIYKISDLDSTTPGVTVLATSVAAQIQTASMYNNDRWLGTNTLPCVVYIPQGEDVIVELSITNITVAAGPPMAPGESAVGYTRELPLSQCGRGVLSASVSNNGSLGMNIGVTYALAQKTQLVQDVTGPLITLQRYAFARVNGGLLKAGNSIEVRLSTGTSPTLAGVMQKSLHTDTVLYDLPNISLDPTTFAQDTLYPMRDYRFDAQSLTPPASRPQRQYYHLIVNLDPFRAAPTDSAGNPLISLEAYSRVSNTITDTFPSFTSVDLLGSTEASFTDPYAPADYLNDIYTSRVIAATSVTKFGKLGVVYQENQQQLIFQIRTGSSASAIKGNAWNNVAANEAIPDTAINASGDGFIQWRVIFQDDPDKQSSSAGPSVVSSVTVNWGTSLLALAPLMPATLTFFKGQVIGSWASSESRQLDHTMYMDTFTDEQGNRQPRFATWTNIHFCAFTVATDKLIAGGIHGGKLYRLFHSAIGDDAQAWPNAYKGKEAIVVTVPVAFSTSQIKTLYWSYFGFEINFYKNGYVQGTLNAYQTITDGSNTEDPYFTWGISANPLGIALLNATPGFPLMDVFADQSYASLLTHIADASGQGENLKPYQNEYGFDLAMQERAFTFGARFAPYLGVDSSGNDVAIFPSLTGIGVEFHLDNLRGV